MSVEYVIYSRKQAAELDEAVNDCYELLVGWYTRHADPGDQVGTFEVGGDLPGAADAASMVWEGDSPAAASSPKVARVLGELHKIKSAITIERPGDWELDPLQLSTFRFLARRAGEGLVQLVDALELTSDVLAELEPLRGAPDFDGGDVSEPDGAGAVEPERQESPFATYFRALEALIATWEERELLEFEPGADRSVFAERLFKFISKNAGSTDGLVDWLMDIDDVAEIYGSDDDMEADLQALGATTG